MLPCSTKGRLGICSTRLEFHWDEWLSSVQPTWGESISQSMTKRKQILATCVWLLTQPIYWWLGVKWSKSCTDITLSTLADLKSIICDHLWKKTHTEWYIVQSKEWFRKTTYESKFYLKNWLFMTDLSIHSMLKCFLSSQSRNQSTLTSNLVSTKFQIKSTLKLNSKLTLPNGLKNLLTWTWFQIPMTPFRCRFVPRKLPQILKKIFSVRLPWRSLSDTWGSSRSLIDWLFKSSSSK